MTLLYLVFFGVINFLVFCYLTKKVQISLKIKIGLFLFLSIVVGLHFFMFFDTVISLNQFFYLLSASAILIVIHYLSMLPILILKSFNKNFENQIILKGFNFLRYYIIYLFTYLVQFSILLSENT